MFLWNSLTWVSLIMDLSFRMILVENKKRERMQREEGENAERRGRETERRERLK